MTGPSAITILTIDLGAGTYTLSLSGAVDSSLEAEGGFAFVGDPSTVPEPATWAMMLLGFTSLGFVLRRRPAQAAFAG